MTKIFVPKETRAHEKRVAATPETVEKLRAAGFTVAIESGAGDLARFPDEAYIHAGAEVDPDADGSDADIVLRVAAPDGDTPNEVGRLRPGTVLVGLLSPLEDLARTQQLAQSGVTSFAMELIPRISRAQSMDALSSQANIAGYKSVLLAADHSRRFFPLLMTAAGTVEPARVVILGGGVAGLQALATARRLGAIVEVSDIRPEVAEQVESLGGRFIDLPDLDDGSGEGGYAKEVGEDFLRRQREILAEHLRTADAVITTALVPGKRAPILLTEEMVSELQPGAVVVDLAADQGGNCALTRPGETFEDGGVTFLGPRNVPAELATDASTLYARNLLSFVALLHDDGEVLSDFDDEILMASLLTRGGEVVHPSVVAAMKGDT